MKALSRIHVWYPKIDKDIESLVKQCEDCSRVANEPPKSVPHPWDWPTDVMDRIHVDYFEYERDMFLIMVDSFSKWADVEIMRNTNSQSTIKCLEQWFTGYGLPNQIVTDNGSQFKSEEFSRYLARNGIKHVCSPVYHQSTNGQVERYVQSVKKGLKVAKYEKSDLQGKLNKVLTSMRSTPSTNTGVTPSALFLGRQMKTKLDLVKPQKIEIRSKSECYENLKSVIK